MRLRNADLVHAAIAVVVEVVADLDRARVHGDVAVVAVIVVRRDVRQAEEHVRSVFADVFLDERFASAHVPVHVGVPGRGAHNAFRVLVVDEAVAVVVHPVAHFLGARMYQGRERVFREVVAVRSVRHVDHIGAGRLLTRRDDGVEVSVRVAGPIAVVVRVPGRGVHRVVVRHAVAVLVQAVADLVRVGGHGRIVVIAVGVIGVVAHRTLVRAGHDGGDVLVGRGAAVAVSVRVPGPRVDGVRFRIAVTVFIDAHVVEVAVFRGARVHGGIRIVAVLGVRDVALDVLTQRHGERGVAVAIAIAIEVLARHGIVVHRAVAVVVEAVAELRGVLVDVRVAVVAVLVVLHLTLDEGAGLYHGIDVAVAVAVHVAVGLEGRARSGVDGRVGRVVDRERGVDGRVGGGGGGGTGQDGQNEHGEHGTPGGRGFWVPNIGRQDSIKKTANCQPFLANLRCFLRSDAHFNGSPVCLASFFVIAEARLLVREVFVECDS